MLATLFRQSRNAAGQRPELRTRHLEFTEASVALHHESNGCSRSARTVDHRRHRLLPVRCPKDLDHWRWCPDVRRADPRRRSQAPRWRTDCPAVHPRCTAVTPHGIVEDATVTLQGGVIVEGRGARHPQPWRHRWAWALLLPGLVDVHSDALAASAGAITRSGADAASFTLHAVEGQLPRRRHHHGPARHRVHRSSHGVDDRHGPRSLRCDRGSPHRSGCDRRPPHPLRLRHRRVARASERSRHAWMVVTARRRQR